MDRIQYGTCRALLFKAAPTALGGKIEVKCRRCRTLNVFRPVEAHHPSAAVEVHERSKDQ